MDLLANFASSVLSQLQSPTLAFLIGGMVLAATGSKLAIPDAVCCQPFSRRSLASSQFCLAQQHWDGFRA